MRLAAGFLPQLLAALLLVLAGTAACSPARAATPAGTLIGNTAVASYTDGPSSGAVSRNSNTVSVTTVTLNYPISIEFMAYAPQLAGAKQYQVATGAYQAGSEAGAPLRALPAPMLPGSGSAIDLSKPLPLAPATVYHSGEPVFVKVTDLARDLDPNAVETITTKVTDPTTGESEVIRLTETGPDTGVFIGYIQSGAGSTTTYNGTLSVGSASKVAATYTDGTTVTSAALVDPYGILFDSATGKPVDGVTITLLDAATGKPADVRGDDGVSSFPATVTTGAVVADTSGRLYAFPPGGFRYPFINPGSYRFLVTPPLGYAAPSAVPDFVLQSLPGGPFSVTVGSRLEVFAVNPGPAIHIDIPLDPIKAALWLQKSAGKTSVAMGDFLPYQLDLQNSDPEATAVGVLITDTLPPGFSYRKGSAVLNGAPTGDPAISADHRTLTFKVGNLAPKSGLSLRYVVEVAAGAKPGEAVNRARAIAGTSSSNMAQASVQVSSPFLNSRSLLMGEVVADGCNAGGHEAAGVPGIRLMLEDGSYVVTDKNGRYHFEGITPDAHVVQVDLASIPVKYSIVACEENSRHAGSAYSQFVDLQGGTLWRADFHLAPRPAATGEAGLELKSELNKSPGKNDQVQYSVPIRIGKVPVRNLRLTVMLPDGASYLAGSSMLDGAPLPDPVERFGALTYPLGDMDGNTEKSVLFKVTVPHEGAAGELATKALLTFDTPTRSDLRTPVAENLLARSVSAATAPAQQAPVPVVAPSPAPAQPTVEVVEERVREVREKSVMVMPEFVLHPHFPTFGAELSDEDRLSLDELAAQLAPLQIEQISVTGHTDWVRIAPRSRGIYRNNKALSLARAYSVGNYLIRKLNLPQSTLVFAGKGEDEPVADNRTARGRAQNRRVQIKVRASKVVENTRQVTEKVVLSKPAPAVQVQAAQAEAQRPAAPPAQALSFEIENRKDQSGLKSVPTVGLPPGESWANSAVERAAAAAKEMPEYDASWLAKAEPGAAWLWPSEGAHPPIPSVMLAVKHDPRQPLKLLVNGSELDGIYLEGTVKRADSLVAVSVWRGVHLEDGDNVFEAVQKDAAGQEIRIRRIIHYSTAPVKAEPVAARSTLIADGRTPPVIAVRLTDKDGHPARQGVIGEYLVEPPFAPRRGAEAGKGAASAQETLKYQVGEDGIALIELEPTTRTGEAQLKLKLGSGSHEVRSWIKPEYRDWILVGLGEGTVGYNAVSGHLEDLRQAGEDEHLYKDGRVAFYAKGQVKGEWLITAAFDSVRGRGEQTNKSLFQTIDPNSYYTLYGDAGNQQYDAASQKKLYLKVERDQFYALFGDFDTGLTVTELSRYSRRLNGIKSEYHGERLEANLFGSETAQAYVRDEIQGDGTSGLYRLSRRNLVLNSDTITIQTRDRFRSEIIINSTVLNRFTDYSIDYQAGTLFFKQPVRSRDENFNPVFVVAEYETADAGREAYTYGGRVGVKLLHDTLRTGLSYVHEGQVTGSGNLYGVDAGVRLGANTTLKGEFAHTGSDFGGASRQGNAYLAELQQQGPRLQGKAYLREQDNGFGLGQQNGSEIGTRKGGIDASYKLTEQLTLGGQAYRQYNLATGGVQDIAEAKGNFTSESYQAHLGYRYADDRLGDGSEHRSDQLTSGISWLTLKKRLTLRVDHDQSIGSGGNASFPTRTTLGADFKLNEKSSLFAQQEFTSGSGARTNTTSAGLKSTPWEGGAVNSTLGQNSDENRARIFALFGLKQNWRVTDKWTLDAGLDRSQTIRTIRYYQFNSNVPDASGATQDFTAVSLGSGYTQQSWNWNGRVEYRTSTAEDKWNLLTSYVAEPVTGVGWSLRFLLQDAEESDGSKKVSCDLRLGAVYRPLRGSLILLDRLDFLYDRQKGSAAIPGTTPLNSDSDDRRVVNNLNLNLKPSARSQLSLLYGSRYALARIDGKKYDGYSDLLALEWRYDLNRQWDLGGRGSVLHSWSARQFSYSAGPSVGYSVMKNTWVSLGYNLVGFSDRDFSAADYTAQGPFIRFRFKFDQNSAKQAAEWLNRQ